ncbi:ABC transporter G family member [Yarrowia sp. B02]|nr:ABC transporter G family member [Yarrowia sp. B02]
MLVKSLVAGLLAISTLADALTGSLETAHSKRLVPPGRGGKKPTKPGQPGKRPDDCPPCFNCLLPDFPCQQFAACDQANGRCHCPEGFTGENCAQPVCGGLGELNRPGRMENTTCECSEGWEGINCNLCNQDAACNRFFPKGVNGTCYTGGMLVRENHQMCDVTNVKIVEILKGQKPEVTFTCKKEDEAEDGAANGTCSFQFWVDQVESFYCGLDECTFETAGNNTLYKCEKIKCACVPDQFLCGKDGSVDLTDFLKNTITGPGDFSCDLNSQNCKFSEPNMNTLISSVFGDKYITLGCKSAECLHISEIPGYDQPNKGVSTLLVGAGLALTLLFLIVAYALAQSLFKRSNSPLEYLPDADETGKLLHDFVPAKLEFEDISYRERGANESTSKPILDGDIFGSVKPGEVMAIMGGSGAGKTTLLDILARKKKSGKLDGRVFVNGSSDYTDKEFKNMIGFVDQEDCLLPTLTVYETVLTSALLRLPKNMTLLGKKMRVLETLNELGIMHIRDKLIGSETNRGISGGEKRRVSIACELVTSPSILFLDEPTSGLDSFSAFNVVESLVHLARNYNRTVVFTIHQPRSNIVQLFDNLLILCQGRLVYSGAYLECQQFFSEVGYNIPKGFNIADFLIDLTMELSSGSGDSSRSESGAQSPSTSSDDIHTVERTDSQGNLDTTNEWLHYQIHRAEFDESANARKRRQRQKFVKSLGSGVPMPDRNLDELVNLFQTSALAQRIKNGIQEDVDQADIAEAEDADDSTVGLLHQRARFFNSRISFLSQLKIIAGRTFKNLYRDPMLLLTHYIMALALGLFSGIVYYQVTDDISGFQNRLGLFFFLLSLFGFSTLTSLNLLFGNDRIIFMRERAKGYYHPAVYYIGKVVFDMVTLRVFPPIILGSILYPLVGLKPDFNSFLVFIATLVLFNLGSSALVFVIGITLGANPGVANLVGILVMLFSMLFAGLFVNHDSVKIWGIDALQFLSVFHYAYEAISVNEVKYLTLIEEKYGLEIEVPGATVLSTFGFDVNAVSRDLFMLTGFLGFMLLAGYIGLHYVLVEVR